MRETLGDSWVVEHGEAVGIGVMCFVDRRHLAD